MERFTQSDWIAIVLALIGVFAGAWFSWMFFRAQQKTDFRAVSEGLDALKIQVADGFGSLSNSHNLRDEIRSVRDNSLNAGISSLDAKLQDLPKQFAEIYKSTQESHVNIVLKDVEIKMNEMRFQLEEIIRRSINIESNGGISADIIVTMSRQCTELAAQFLKGQSDALIKSIGDSGEIARQLIEPMAEGALISLSEGYVQTTEERGLSKISFEEYIRARVRRRKEEAKAKGRVNESNGKR